MKDGFLRIGNRETEKAENGEKSCWELTVPDCVQLPVGLLQTTQAARAPGRLPPDILLVDEEKWKGPFLLRYWKAGDRMKPFGMEGSKLVSDILTDRHIPDRERQLVLLSGNEILWIPGVQASEGTRIGTIHGNLVEFDFLPKGENLSWKK